MNAELILVNNGSKDKTEGVAAVKTSANFKVRYAHEPIRGLSQARNVGIRLAKGEILLFIDDDVRPTTSWLRDMCAPILEGRADAVAGG